MRRLVALIIGLATLATLSHGVLLAAGGAIRLTVECYSNPERTTIANETNDPITLNGSTLGSIYDTRPSEPFALVGNIPPGGAVTYETGSLATTNILAYQLIYHDREETEGARFTSPFGTLEATCEQGSNSLPIGADIPPPPVVRPAFQNLTPAPFSTVAPGATTLAVNVSSDSAITQLSLRLNGVELNPEVGGQSESQVAAFTERDLAPGLYTLTASATDNDGDSFAAQWDFVVAASSEESEWFTASGQPKADQINATMRSLVEAFRWHLYGQSWDGQNHPDLPSHVGLTGQGAPVAEWVTGTTFNRQATEETLRSLVEAFRWHFWGISWDNGPHCDIPTHIANCTTPLPAEGIDPWFTGNGAPRREKIEATLRSLVESFRWHFWGYSWDGGQHEDLPSHAYQ